jgi:hypothetical protein
MTQRPKKSDQQQVQNEELDEALEESFPASDPPSMTQPKPCGDKMKERPAAKPVRGEDEDDVTRVEQYEDEDK